LRIQAPDPALHRSGIYELTARAFSRGSGYWGWMDHCRGGYWEDSPYDWEASRIGLLGDRIVTHFGVWGHGFRIGSCVVRAAGIGAVATDGTLLRRGLMRTTAAACVEALAGHGYDLTMLFGIRDFYHRFGYVRCFVGPDWIVRAEHLRPTCKTPRLKRVTSDWDGLADVANRTYGGITGTAVRPTYHHNPSPKLRKGYRWDDDRGGVRGFVVVAEHRDRFYVVDHGGDEEEVTAAVASLARKASFREVTFEALPYHTALCRRLRRGTCRLEQTFVERGAAMGRLCDLERTLRKISPELGRRLRRSAAGDWCGELLLADARERVVLAIEAGRVRVRRPERGERFAHAIRGGEEMLQLIIGSDEPSEVAAMASMRLTGEAPRLLPVLFPDQKPCLPVWDHY
jgi:predicted N-acetyltransferase YhbS